MHINDWHHYLRSVMRHEEKKYILTESLPEKPCDKIRQSERYGIIRSLVRYKMSDNESISVHIMSYIERLGKLGCQLDMQLITDFVLDSLIS
jgi:hypothetical protein